MHIGDGEDGDAAPRHEGRDETRARRETKAPKRGSETKRNEAKRKTFLLAGAFPQRGTRCHSVGVRL